MNDIDMTQYPLISLPGSEGYLATYNWANQLETLFAEQDIHDFLYACEYNTWGPLSGGHDVAGYGESPPTLNLAGLLMVEQGERDEGAWVWLVTTITGEHWVATGSCDYTGWDCQSGLDWERFEPEAS